MERLSAWLHRRIYGDDGFLCARAAWRGGIVWRVFRVVVETLHDEPQHCDWCLIRWLRHDNSEVSQEWAQRFLWLLR